MSFLSDVKSALPLLAAVSLWGGPSAAQGAEDCLLKPGADVQLAVQAPGVVRDVTVGRGDTVTRGDVLLTQVDRMEAAALAVAQARSEDRSAIDGVQARLAVAEAQLQRVRNLADGSLVTRERLEAAEQDALLLRQELAAARGRQRIAVLEAAEAREAHDRLILKAPIDGVVTERFVDPGEFASEQAPVLSIADLDPLLVEAWIGAAYWGHVVAGDTADVLVGNDPETRRAAWVTSVDPVIETVSETFRVTLELPNPGLRLPAGLPCRIEMDSRPIDRAAR